MTVAPQTWQVYDMDGVITTKNCFYSYLRYRLTTSARRFVTAIPALVRMARAMDHETKVQQGFALTTVALAGLSLAQYNDEIERFGARLAHEPGRLRQDVITHLRAQHAAGAHIVIATACEQSLARAVLVAANVPYETLSATQFAQSDEGILVTDPRVDERKARALQELGIPLDQAEFYTDDVSDLATARLCTRTHLVGASPETVDSFRAQGVEVDVWASK